MVTHYRPASLRTQLLKARAWCKQQRAAWPASDTVWSVSKNWHLEKKTMFGAFDDGTYYFEPVKILRNHSGVETHFIWHARDAIMLKALTLSLLPKLQSRISKYCTHIKDNGSIPKAVQTARDVAPNYQFVFKSDVKGFYESINHGILMQQLTTISNCPRFFTFMKRFLEHTEEFGGLYNTLTKGISKSCPISPLLGAVYLSPLDEAMESLPVKYIRYMDDWIVFAKTKWQLRKAIKIANQVLTELKLAKAPDKTFIGRVNKTFEFCGFRFSTEGVIGLAKKTQERFQNKVRMVYEQAKQAPKCDEVKRYIKRFEGWVKGVTADSLEVIISQGSVRCQPKFRQEPLGLAPKSGGVTL